MDNKYKLIINRRERRPRSERLRKLGYNPAGRSGGGGAVVQVTGGGSYTPTYDPSLDKLVLTEDLILAARQDEILEKVKVGYADYAGHSNTAGKANIARDSEKWNGNVFDEYIDQPVRTIDDVTFKKITASTMNVTTQNISHIGGKLLLTAARCVADAVVPTGQHFKVYFRGADENGTVIANEWQVGDFAVMQTFNLNSNRYYWRRVIQVGSIESGLNFIVLDGLYADTGSVEPQAGDTIVQLGNFLGTEGRTNAIVLSGAGEGSPSVALYKGITSFVMPEPDTIIRPDGSIFSGTVYASGGEFSGDVRAKRYSLTRFYGDVTGIYKTVDGAYITGSGNYILPDLPEGDMVVVKWFNPPYSSSYGSSKFKVENPLTAGIAVATDTGVLNYYRQVQFNLRPSLLYDIIGDHPPGTDKTYWSIIKAGFSPSGDMTSMGNENMEPFPEWDNELTPLT